MINKNSMIFWWPKIKDLDIPMPKTIIVPIDLSFEHILGILDGDREAAKAWDTQIPKILIAIHKVSGKEGAPVFLRTDFLSDKHEWKNSCFVQEPDKIRRHISSLIEATAMADLSLTAMVVREYIEMDSIFTAFWGNMPINPERRYFIKDGEIQCHHVYWIESAITDWHEVLKVAGQPKLSDNWKELLAEANNETKEEIALLSTYAQQVANIMKGYWSVDFCKAKDGRWILIDMAEGGRSWHDESCKYSTDIPF